MTDLEIGQYLRENNYIVKAEDGVFNIFNRSPQIQSINYNHPSGTMIINTADNSFAFKWVLQQYERN